MATDREIHERVMAQTESKMRDLNKAEAEKNVAKALALVKRAYTLYTMADCPAWARHMVAIGKMLEAETPRS